MSAFDEDDLGDLDLPDLGIPEEDIFSFDSDDEYVSVDDVDIKDDIQPDEIDGINENKKSKSKDSSNKNSAPGIKQKIAILSATVIALLFFIWPSSDEIDSTPEEYILEKAADVPDQGGLKDEKSSSITTEMVKTVIGPDTDFKRAYTLETINEADNIIETIQQMKRDLDSLRLTNVGRSESLQSFKEAQQTVYESLAELSRITSAYEVPLDDGGLVIPSRSGFGYTLVSGAGIQSEAKRGVFLMMKNGYLITNQKDLSMIFALRSDQFEGKISNIYKISPTHGLMDKSHDTKELKRVLVLIKPENASKKIKVESMNNMLLFFNEKGQLAARKVYRSVLRDDKKYSDTVKGSIRRVVGFETSDFVLYNFAESLVKIDGVVSKIEGISHGLKARYLEYVGDIETDGSKVIEIMSDGVVIKRFDIAEVETVLLQSATIGKDKYLSKDGLIYKIDVDRQKLLQGSGSILARVHDGQIVGEKIILNESRVKFSNLSSLVGMTLEGKSGREYKISVDHVEISPGNEIKLFDYYLISSKSDLLSKSKIFIDKIVKIKSTGKVGGRIITKNSIIEVRTDKEVTIISKLDKKTRVYVDPKVYFDKEYIVIKIPSVYSIDRAEKKIDGKKYVSEEIVNRDKSRFVMSDGSYFNKSDPVIRVTELEVLRERVIDIESISGSVFDYVYYVDEQTGKISASSIGEFKINHHNAKFDVFNDTDDKKTIATADSIKTKKDVMSFGELMTKNDYFSKVYFKTSSGDTIKVNSPNSIVYNGVNLQIKSGKYNSKVGLLIINLLDGMASKERRRLSISSTTTKIERSVESISYVGESYYVGDVVVLKIDNSNTVIRKNTESGLSSWTKIYSSKADIFKEEIELIIKPINESFEPTETVIIGLANVKEMGESMRLDMIDVYSKYMSQLRRDGVKQTDTQLKIEDNKAILQEKLRVVQEGIDYMLTLGLVINTHKMNQQDVEKYKEEAAEKRSFVFEVGTEITYSIEKSIDISEGEELYIHTDLDQSYFEDREGNTLEMQSPTLILRVVGDFNKSQIIFSPSEIIYTDYKGIRNTIAIPDGSTTLEYTEEDTEYTISGVPAYYVNQKIRELPTTVMLSTLQGVVDSMTAEDPLSAGLAGMESIVGGSETTTASAFTDGVASGASSGIQEILAVYKEKAGGKRDMLISTGELDLKSLFIRTTPISVTDGSAATN